MKLVKDLIFRDLFPKAFALFFALAFTLPAMGQEDDEFIHVYGTIKDYQTRRKLSGVTVSVKQDGKTFKSITTTANGKFEFFLPLDHVYNINYSKSNYIAKNIEIDSKNVPNELRRGGFSMNTDVDIFESVPDIDFSFLENPIGKANWDNAKGEISWNYEYIESVKNQIDRLMKEYDKAKKEEDKEEESANKEEEERNLKFEKLMKDGGIALETKKYDSAVAKYQEAVSLKPDNQLAKDKLEESKKKLDEEKALAEANKKFNEFLDKGDDAFKAKNFEDAIKNYESALEIKDNEKYPKDQIAQAKLKLEELAKVEAEEKEFNDLLAKGDGDVANNEFDGAIESYQKALELKPLDKGVKTKIDKAQKLKDEFLANAAKEEEFQNLVKEADGLFSSENYQESINKYNEALKVKKDAYATEQISKAEEKIKELENAEKEAMELAKKEEEYNSFMSDGERQLSDNKFNEAISSFKEALKIKEGDSTASNKLAAAEKAKEESEANMAKQERYNNLIETAQSQQKSGELEESLSTYQEADKLMSTKDTTTKIAELEDLIEAKKAKEKEEEELAAQAALAEKEKEELDKQFNELVENGDVANDSQDYQVAIDNYKQALSLKTDDRNVKGKLESAEKALEKINAELAAAEQKRLEEEERLAEQKKLEEEERAREKELEEERERQKASEREREKEYERLISIADEQFEDKNFDLAIENYTAAQEFNSENQYAQEQIERIERMKEKQEQERLEEEALAEERRSKEEEAARKRELQKSKFDSDLEQEAEEYMANLRAERIKAKAQKAKDAKENWNATQQDFTQISEEVLVQNQEQIQGYKDEIADRENAFNKESKVKAELVKDTKEDQQSFNSEKSDSQNRRIEDAVGELNSYSDYKKEMAEVGNSLNEEKFEAIADLKMVNQELQTDGVEKQKKSSEEINTQKKVYERNAQRYASEGNKKISDSNYKLVENKKAVSEYYSGRAKEAKDNGTEILSKEKKNLNSFNEKNATSQNQKIKDSKRKVGEVERHNTKPSPDRYGHELAEEYPQGVTEEKLVENGQVILTRYVVVGNKVDVYKKVIGMNRNYFFKNGNSCSEDTWKRESTVVLE